MSARLSRYPWLFSAPVDLAAFLGSAAISLGLLAWGAGHGLLSRETPDWTWVSLVLLVDVAHVYATGFQVYFDRAELSRRPWLYGGVPTVCLLLAVALYSEGPLLFWRVIAYVAVFHFVRQQYGWVALYRARAGEFSRWSHRLDSAAIYLATLYPLAVWHAAPPRRFHWFVEGDFFTLPPWIPGLLFPCYVASLLVYAVRSANSWLRGRPNPGKDVVVATTAACWYTGIVAFDSDYAFLVTNVVIHGVPYLVLIGWRMGHAAEKTPWRRWSAPRIAVTLLATTWLLAYLEELVWHRAVFQERAWLFGSPLEPGAWRGLLVPLLAVPQLTHYVLDGFIWKRRDHPELASPLPSLPGEAGRNTLSSAAADER